MSRKGKQASTPHARIPQFMFAERLALARWDNEGGRTASPTASLSEMLGNSREGTINKQIDESQDSLAPTVIVKPLPIGKAVV